MKPESEVKDFDFHKAPHKDGLLKKMWFFLWDISKPLSGGILFGMVATGIFATSLVLAYNYAYRTIAPDVNKLISNPPAESTKLYDASGQLIYEIYDKERRTVIPLAKVNQFLVHATIAIEDKDFYSHVGISLPSLFRSAITNYYQGENAYGGSTITQQLIKNAVLNPKKSFFRKFAEIIWALEIEKRLSKDQILTLYLNQISYGRGSAGSEAAAQSYFNKSAGDLTLLESAYLAALPQAPSLLDPNGPNRELLEIRKNYILTVMRQQEYITEDQYREALATTVEFRPQYTVFKYPYFSLWIKQNLIKQYGEEKVYSGGLKVHTTLDPHLQDIAERTVREGIQKNIKAYKGNNAALVAIDPKTGYVKAMVGGKSYYDEPAPKGCIPGKNCAFEPNVNTALAMRQPGSSFKPYVYVTAFGDEFRYSPASIISDTSKNFSAEGAPVYRPHNYNGIQYGRVSVRKALAGSLNIAAVNMAYQIGTEPIIGTTRKLGITAPLQNCGLALALGSCEITLLEHVGAFSVLANGGRKNPVTGISRIIDNTDKDLIVFNPVNQDALNPQAVYELTSIMTDNNARTFIFGSNTPLILKDRPVAAKTGTTQNWKDGWTLGFTPSLVAGVWVGNNDGSLLAPGADGVLVAAPIWNSFMSEALKDTPPEEFSEPRGITHVAINPATGQLVGGKVKRPVMEVFADYAVPSNNSKPIAFPTVPERPKEPEIRPLVAGVSTGAVGDQTVILTPAAGSTIYKYPVIVQVYTGTSTLDTVVEISVDGKLFATKTEAPFEFSLPEKYQNGFHTITAKATHFGLLSSSDSIKVKTFFNPPPVEPRGIIPPLEEPIKAGN